MGVRGLQTFLKNNEDVFALRTDLSNTNLVIDANNLLCLLYTSIITDKSSPHYRNDVYGGDLVIYGEKVRLFFTNLERCEITPILVFDGSVIGKKALQEFVASKEEETRRRGQERFDRAKNLSEFEVGDDCMLPQTINITFRNIAAEFGVQRIQCPYEADTHIARVANELHCPVLTNDSDFLIYSLEKGFILLNSFDFEHIRKDKLNKFYIQCKTYTQDKLSRSLLGFDKKNLPLLSVLLGNDYVEARTFDRLMKDICNGPYLGPLRASSFSHRRIANLLTWLSGKDLEDSIRYVLDGVHPSNHNKLNSIIKLLLRSYKIESVDDFDSELEEIYPSHKVAELPDGTKPTTPVAFLRRQMERDDLGSIALDMIFRNTHYNYTIIDDFKLPSSSHVKFRPYSLALVLLRSESYENLSVYRRTIQMQRDSFIIYDRIRDQYTRLTVKPMETLPNFGSLDSMTCYTMINMEPSRKREMMMACFHFNEHDFECINETVSQLFSGDYLEQAALCFILLKYCGVEAKIAPRPEFVSALMITLFYYASQSDCLNKENFSDIANYASLIDKLSPHTVAKNRVVYHNNDQNIFRRIVHFTSQLQAAYKAYCMVNSLLDHVFQSPKQELFFNCTLIHRITKMLRINEWSLEQLCTDLPVLADICDSMHVQVTVGSA